MKVQNPKILSLQWYVKEKQQILSWEAATEEYLAFFFKVLLDKNDKGINLSKWFLIIGSIEWFSSIYCDAFKTKTQSSFGSEDILKSHILLLDHWLAVCHNNIHHYHHCHSLTLFGFYTSDTDCTIVVSMIDIFCAK